MTGAEWQAIRARTAVILSEQAWADVERAAREVKLLRLEHKLGIGAFKGRL